MVTRTRAGILATGMTIAVMILSAMPPAGAASPDAPREDVFGRNTGPAPSAGNRAPISGHLSSVNITTAPAPSNVPNPPVSSQSTPSQWFTAFDTYVGFFTPSGEDKMLMNQPFNQELERVTAFCKTSAKVARNYRLLARKLRSLPMPAEIKDPKLTSLRRLTADWYDDSALLLEDMVKPRPPARTKEELASMIKDLQERSESLKKNSEYLQEMDGEIRRKFNVPPPQYDDALRQYAGHH
ncbi:MAG: hypothetical protein K2X27_06525 [Candidatus Obscuribacterales bacterium]|nr:hypothetical protein [Candidatus Obscuribacterales bacterium]